MKAFITGVSEGIGRALAKQLVAEGHIVWGVARREELLKGLQHELGEKFLFSVCDVSNETMVDATMAAMEKCDFVPDAVILNAVAFPEDTEPHYNHLLLVRTYGINIFGVLIWVEKFVEKFSHRGYGTFVAISSSSAFRPDPKSVSLPSSKAALSMAFRSLRLRYAKEKIKFNLVYLGPVATSLVPKWLSPSGNPRYFFVLNPDQAAKGIMRAIHGKNGNYWFPRFTMLLFRASLILPDRFFVFITRKLKG